MADQTIFQKLMSNVSFIRNCIDLPVLDEYIYSFDVENGLCGSPSPMVGVSPKPLNDLIVGKKAVIECPYSIRYLGPDVIKNKDILKTALNIYSDAIDLIPENIINDVSIFDDKLAQIIINDSNSEPYNIACLSDFYKEKYNLSKDTREEVRQQDKITCLLLSSMMAVTYSQLREDKKKIRQSDIEYKINSIGIENNLSQDEINICIEIHNKKKYNLPISDKIRNCGEILRIICECSFPTKNKISIVELTSDNLLNDGNFIDKITEDSKTCRSPLNFFYCGSKLKENRTFIKKYALRSFIILGYCNENIQNDSSFIREILNEYNISIDKYM
jgi:hypothetical protein